jgi:long-chain acyl-CoA synthetase
MRFFLLFSKNILFLCILANIKNVIRKNFIKLYENSLKEHWELPALSDYAGGTTLTYGDLAQKIARLHVLFDKIGIEKGDKIALSGKNHSAWCTVFLATITYGAVIVPVLSYFHPENIEHIIEHSESKLVFMDESVWSQVTKGKITVPVFEIPSFKLFQCDDESLWKMVNRWDELCEEKYPDGFRKEQVIYPEIDNSEVICLNYTSGTPGFCRGVMLTANNFAGNVTFADKVNLLFEGERNLAFLPLAHAYGCTFDFLYPLSEGVHITLLDTIPSFRNLVQALQKVKSHIIITVPLTFENIYHRKILPLINKPLMKLLLRTPLINRLVLCKMRCYLMNLFGGNFREVIIGGAALNREVEAFFYQLKFPFTVGYGMTECAPLISYESHRNFVPTSCGKVLEGIMEARIDSADPERIPGEIQVRGENVMKGYFKNPQATAAAFTKDGWLKTGDLGVMDKEKRLYIKGIIKSMLLGPNGQNIYPEEIEARLNSLPYVAESLVVERNGKLVALVYPDHEALNADNIPQEKLPQIMERNRMALNRQLARYEKISKIEIYNAEFEKTPSKNIRRYLYQ